MFGDPNEPLKSVPFEMVFTIRDDLRKPINDAVRADMHENAEYPYYGANGQVDIINEYLMDCTALCLAEDCGAYGAGDTTSYIVDGKCWVNNHAHVLIPKECCDINYANAFFRVMDLSKYVSGTTRLKLTQRKMKEIPVILPEFDQQIMFADFVSQSDKSKFYGKSQFIEMFGTVDNNINGWDVKTWDDILFIRNGKAHKNVNDPNGEYPIYGSGGKMGMATEYLSPEHTIILGRKGTINRPFISYEKCWIVDTSFGLEVNPDLMNYRFFHQWCTLFDFQSLNRAAVLPSLTKGDLLKISIIVPPLEKQNQFVELAEQSDKSKLSSIS
ncbi:restriction endonuclease subunit S [Holdemanella biformis]|uniref:Type I restriction modification DNA specificity domain-containing protein n=1 Tax=Holdemanella biformis TaxID=1735 RepID=A0A412IYI5_9FIRM|nr:restriction endonuclease subunit S [Holdemanella biformis]RGS45281.1 hypothetical protein DWX92_08515 [Holdemanella biformis]